MRDFVGGMGQILAWVHKILAWMTWVAQVEILAWVAWVHKILDCVVWVEILTWMVWTKKNEVGQKTAWL